MNTSLKLFFILGLYPFLASAAKLPPCYDFTKPISAPLRPLPKLEGTEDVFVTGTEKDDSFWTQAVGTVPGTVLDVVNWLRAHENWKDMSRTKLVTKTTYPKGFMEQQRLEVDLHVWAFINIDWVEQWAFTILKGTAERPEVALASYEKIEGTGHLPKLCGSVWISKLSPDTVRVYFYELAKAEQYDLKTMTQMFRDHFGKLRRLRDTSESALTEVR